MATSTSTSAAHSATNTPTRCPVDAPAHGGGVRGEGRRGEGWGGRNGHEGWQGCGGKDGVGCVLRACVCVIALCVCEYILVETMNKGGEGGAIDQRGGAGGDQETKARSKRAEAGIEGLQPHAGVKQRAIRRWEGGQGRLREVGGHNIQDVTP